MERERPKVVGGDAKRFLEKALRNQETRRKLVRKLVNKTIQENYEALKRLDD